jgi:hypothetical protein
VECPALHLQRRKWRCIFEGEERLLRPLALAVGAFQDEKKPADLTLGRFIHPDDSALVSSIAIEIRVNEKD